LDPWGIIVDYNVFSLCESLPNMKNEIRAKDFVAIFQFFLKRPNFEKKKRKISPHLDSDGNFVAFKIFFF